MIIHIKTEAKKNFLDFGKKGPQSNNCGSRFIQTIYKKYTLASMGATTNRQQKALDLLVAVDRIAKVISNVYSLY